MRKLITIAMAVAFAGMLVPGVEAETASREYIGGGARVAGVGLGVITCQDPGLGIDDLYPECEALRLAGYDGGVGGSNLAVSGTFANVVVSTSDSMYGSNGGFSVCFYNPEGDNFCDDDDYSTGTGCGTRPLLGSPFAGNTVSVFTYSFVVTEDLDQCGALDGVITGDFF